MKRIERLFTELQRPVLIGFTVAGYPDLGTSEAIARAMIRGGIDLLELGIPHSDPVADGPTIQRADDRALQAGTDPDLVFALVRSLRRDTDDPIILLCYYNTVYQRAFDRFYRDARIAGVDGVLIVDMPLEESEEAVASARKEELDQIFLVAPTTSDRRLEKIVDVAEGFLYLVSRRGVTGARDVIPHDIGDLIRKIRSYTHLPVAVGFGISQPAHVGAICQAGADGVIVGSAIIEQVEQHLDHPQTMLREVEAYITSLATVVREQGRNAGSRD